MFVPDGWEILNGVFKELPNTILMQYTGLKDKNGKEIYEGDILRFYLDGEEFHTSPVSFHAEMSAFVLTEPVPEDMFVKECGYEVIGNIYESPELLKVDVRAIL
jgi:hypothetical protein